MQNINHPQLFMLLPESNISIRNVARIVFMSYIKNFYHNDIVAKYYADWFDSSEMFICDDGAYRDNEYVMQMKENLDRAVVLSRLELDRHGGTSFSYSAAKIYEDACRRSYRKSKGASVDEADVDFAMGDMDYCLKRFGEYSAQYEAALSHYNAVYSAWNRDNVKLPVIVKKPSESPSIDVLRANLDRAISATQDAIKRHGVGSFAHIASQVYEDAARTSYNEVACAEYFDDDVYENNDFTIM